VDRVDGAAPAPEQSPLGKPIRVLIVDDSAAIRELLSRVLRVDGRFEVVGAARDGEEAVALAARLHPDVITMDLHLPKLNGVLATRRIMVETPTPIVVVSSSIEKKEIGLAFDAIQAGAVTVLEKPPGPEHPRHAAAIRELLTTIRVMAQVKVVRRWATSAAEARPAAQAGPPAQAAPPTDARHTGQSGSASHQLHQPQAASAGRRRRRRPLAIMIVASTGGPQAIQTLLRGLGPDVPVPVLIVQHISEGFADGMAAWLSSTCGHHVRIAEHGDAPSAGGVYLAPGDRHLLVTRRGTLALSSAPAVGGFRPSGTLLFESGSEYYGADAVGVLLTGMGEDGAVGLSALRKAGAHTIAQDEASCVVYGMPAAAVGLGAAEQVLPIREIGGELRTLLGLPPLGLPPTTPIRPPLRGQHDGRS
jgi:two-component system chemotaxis response regulator CheB